MTLADFLNPRAATAAAAATSSPTGDIAPLSHCFHLETSIRVMLALLDGIDYIHSRGIVHRDLKPANIFLRLEKNPRAKEGCVDLMLCSHCRASNAANPAMISVCIGDFGLVSKIAEDIDGGPSPTRKAVSPVGTELYRPIALPTSVSPSLDIFSLGVIAFELLYKFNTQMERRETLQNLRAGQFPPAFPLQAKELISSMLCHDVAAQVTIPELKSRLSAMLVT
jgi:translation initiation factor 2-alpha kinase 3